jgi:hypothetical protein
MSAVVFAVAAGAAVACPAHMLWQMRRGRRAMCGPAPSQHDDVAAVRRRQGDLDARIAKLSVENVDDDRPYAPTGRG